MRVSKMGMKNVKLSNLDEMYPVQDILMQTNQVKQYGSGVYAYDNVPLKVQDNIEEIIKRNFNKADFIEVQMPLLQQDELWKRSGRYDKYIEEGVMMLSETDKGIYCLAPTAEEAITTFVENRITSHKQLPVGFYQIGPKFRNEIRNRGYLLRGREFLMFDLYTFDKDEIGMMESYKKIRETYFKAFNEIGLDIVAVAADNGSMGGKNSEEIMAISTIGEDTILFDEETKQGLNVEVLEKDSATGYEVVIEGGKILSKEETGCPNGTSITIENLFYNTPVRYKFLKKDFTESGYIEDVVTRIALVHPEIAIRLINTGKTVIQTSGNGDIQSIIYGIYGKEIAENLINIDYVYEDIKVGAPKIIIAHNHPSGDPTPSLADFEITNRIEKAGQIMGIELLDHIVIGDCNYISIFSKRGVNNV